MKRLLFVFVLFLCSYFTIFAGPFGLEKGMTYAQVKTACGGREPVKIDEGKYLITPVKPHPYFTRYVAWIDDKEGLNYIKAIGADIETSGYGIEVQEKYDSLETALTKAYGTGDRTDDLLPGSIWNDPDDWMSGIEKKERFLMTSWTTEKGATLPDTLAGVYMAVFAESSSSGSIWLEYEFSNHEKVSKAQKESEDSVL